MKKTLKTFVRFENNQPTPQYLAKEKTPTELPELKRKGAQYTN